MVETGLLNAADDFSVLPELDVIAICVPTPLTRNLTPDLQHIEFVTRKITASLRPGQLVTLESTTYPGTTEEFILPILLESGLKAEKQFFLVHSPERVDPGNPRFSTRNTSKIIGGVGPASLEIALCFYGQTIKQLIPVSSAQAAEMAKVFENTFRAVNIALVNEIALLCNRMNLNVWEVLDAAFTKPFGLMPFYPGPV
jgi:nucleotide sugar dehydrogenase